VIGNNPHDESAATLIRPVDALERLFYRYSERNPAHFLVVAEFGEVLTADQLRPALAAVQRRHPLLSAHVEDRPGTRLGFYRAASVAPIELTIHRDPESSWQATAAEELSRMFDRSHAPLMRASLLQGPTGSALLLTFDHTIADGISSVMVLNDVVAALNGANLSNLPIAQSQEHMISRTLGEIHPFDSSELPDDPRMRRPNTIRPFDGTLTNVHTMAMTDTDTASLVERCRAESTTVHAAILTATCRVRSAQRGEDFVRVLNPINFRALIGVERDCALYIQTTWTGLAPWDGTPFWEQARMMTAHLDVARSERGILTASLAIRQAITADAEVGHTEELFARVCPFDMLVTNLGVQNLDGTGPLRPAAVWGPVVQAQIDGEYITGITTYEGRLRMVTCGHSVPSTFLKAVAAALIAAVEET
jgi:Condensation domain